MTRSELRWLLGRHRETIGLARQPGDDVLARVERFNFDTTALDSALGSVGAAAIRKALQAFRDDVVHANRAYVAPLLFLGRGFARGMGMGLGDRDALWSVVSPKLGGTLTEFLGDHLEYPTGESLVEYSLKAMDELETDPEITETIRGLNRATLVLVWTAFKQLGREIRQALCACDLPRWPGWKGSIAGIHAAFRAIAGPEAALPEGEARALVRLAKAGRTLPAAELPVRPLDQDMMDVANAAIRAAAMMGTGADSVLQSGTPVK